MATSVFRGFKIKGIDEERLPPKAKREPRPIGPPYPGTNLTPFEYPRYTVFILLEPIRNSDDDPLPNIDSEIRRIWKQFFNEGSRRLVHYHQENQQRRNPDDPDLPSIGLTYYEVGDCGEIRIVNTHLQEVEELIEEPRDNEERLRKLKSLVEWVNKKYLEN